MELNSVVNDLIDITREKCQYLEEIYVLTEGQVNAVEENNLDDLNDLIVGKQLKIDHIKELDLKFEEIVDRIRNEINFTNLNDLPCEATEGLCDEINNIRAIVRKITSVEKKNLKVLNDKKDGLHDKIMHTNKGKIAMLQYSGGSSYMDAVFFDKKIK